MKILNFIYIYIKFIRKNISNNNNNLYYINSVINLINKLIKIKFKNKNNLIKLYYFKNNNFKNISNYTNYNIFLNSYKYNKNYNLTYNRYLNNDCYKKKHYFYYNENLIFFNYKLISVNTTLNGSSSSSSSSSNITLKTIRFKYKDNKTVIFFLKNLKILKLNHFNFNYIENYSKFIINNINTILTSLTNTYKEELGVDILKKKIIYLKIFKKNTLINHNWKYIIYKKKYNMLFIKNNLKKKFKLNLNIIKLFKNDTLLLNNNTNYNLRNTEISINNYNYFKFKCLIFNLSYFWNKKISLNVLNFKNIINKKYILLESNILKYNFPISKKYIHTGTLVELLLLSLKIKDLEFITKWLRRLLERHDFKNHKKYIQLIKFLICERVVLYKNYLKIKGVYLKISGKVGVGGSSKKRKNYSIFGEVSNSNKDLKQTRSEFIISTKSGILGIKFIIYY